MTDKRYVVIEGSESGHCCFEATVIDTHNKDSLGEGHICECFDTPDAEKIAMALNKLYDGEVSE